MKNEADEDDLLIWAKISSQSDFYGSSLHEIAPMVDRSKLHASGYFKKAS